MDRHLRVQGRIGLNPALVSETIREGDEVENSEGTQRLEVGAEVPDWRVRRVAGIHGSLWRVTAGETV